ncbi:MAG: stage II sporulation protein M [Candidatus Aenigmarchaeota archaeon]|nr:stage II sporulation protein M [Candidatus Aenigmarchaeota archaeon]
MKEIIVAFIFGIVFGFFGSKVLLAIFPNLVPYVKASMPVSTMFEIFFKNSFLATLICFGGLMFSFAEIRVYKFSRIYRAFDKIYDPLYFFLKKLSKNYMKLASMYRSCYFSLFTFPVVCIFLIAFLISLYFFTFLSILGLSSIIILQRLLPHLFLELSVFVFSAKMALDIAEKLEKYIFQKEIRTFEREGKKLFKSREIWKRLFVLYCILFVAAVLEKIFIEIIF